MKFSSKQMIGENLLYLMVWMVIILVPVLNSKMLEEVHVSLENILIAWLKIAPYLLIFIIHNSLIAPRLLLRKHRYVWYLVVNLLTITAVFSLVAIYEKKYAPYDTEPYILNGKASFTDLAIYWNILLGFFMTGLNMGIKLLYRSLRDEQQMEELKRQNLQAEMDYLRYQINPHFFMNTLNNIHALIDIDTEYAKSAVIELSKMMRYVLYESGSETISLKKDIQFIENYIELMRIRYDSSIDIRFDYPDSIPNKVAIPPLLLIVFVENAFKHGVSYNHASFIQIRIGYRDDAVTAVISNSRHEKIPVGYYGHRTRKRQKTAGIDLPGQLYARYRRFRSGRLYRQTHNPHHAMLKCIAIDDEPLALRQLQGYIAKINFLKLEKAFTNAIEAQQYLAGNPIDLIFVDINMPDLSGVEFVRSLVSRPMIIFTTAYSEYAVEGFKLDAIDYLLKPFSFADFNRSVTKAQSLYELLAYRKTQGDVPAPEATPRDREYISIKADYKTTLVRISDIVYLESEGEYVRLHLDDRSTITTLFRLKNMEAALPSEMFMRVHRSYIVNLQRIRSYVKGRVFISDSEYVPIGENYREAFQRYIEAHYQNL